MIILNFNFQLHYFTSNSYQIFKHKKLTYLSFIIYSKIKQKNLFSQFIKSPVFLKVISFFKFHPLFSCKQFKIDSKSIGLRLKQYSFKIFIIEIVQQKMMIFCYDYDHSIFSNVLSIFFNEKNAENCKITDILEQFKAHICA